MVKQFFTAFVIAGIIDFIWIGLIANRFYLEQFGDMANKADGKFQIVYWAAVGVYVLMALAITMLALPLAQGDIVRALGYGALVGLCMYGVYDLTNHATLRHWPLPLLLADMAWGTFLCAIVSAATMWVSNKWF